MRISITSLAALAWLSACTPAPLVEVPSQIDDRPDFAPQTRFDPAIPAPVDPAAQLQERAQRLRERTAALRAQTHQ